MLTYEEVIRIGMEHYAEGGDGVVECLSREDYEREIAEGNGFAYESEKALLESFRVFDSVRREIWATVW